MTGTKRYKRVGEYVKQKHKIVINGCILLNKRNDSVNKLASCSPTSVNFDKKTPTKVDLRKYCMAEVQDTQDISACVTHAIVAALEYFHYLRKSEKIKFSPLCLYYFARKSDSKNYPYRILDKGCCIEHALAAYEKRGIARECDWKIDSKLVNMKPPDFDLRDMHHDTSFHYEEIVNDLVIIKSFLSEGYPIVAGLLIDEPFYKAGKKDGRIWEVLNLREKPSKNCGEHAMLIVGYKDRQRVFITRNCWGPMWGKAGYCYMPYDYITDPNLCPELFVLKSSAVTKISEVHRIDDADIRRGASPISFDDDDEMLFGASSMSSADVDDDDPIVIMEIDVDDDDDNDSTRGSQRQKDDEAKKNVLKNFGV